MTVNVINIISVKPLDEYVLRIDFDDGTMQDVNFKPFLSKSQHPDIRSYLDHARFALFRIDHGELVWGDYDLCFPMMDLYLNQINKYAVLDEAA
jgi:hypothetical protein